MLATVSLCQMGTLKRAHSAPDRMMEEGQSRPLIPSTVPPEIPPTSSLVAVDHCIQRSITDSVMDSPLLKLPIEVREEIWHYVLCTEGPVVLVQRAQLEKQRARERRRSLNRSQAPYPPQQANPRKDAQDQPSVEGSIEDAVVLDSDDGDWYEHIWESENSGEDSQHDDGEVGLREDQFPNGPVYKDNSAAESTTVVLARAEKKARLRRDAISGDKTVILANIMSLLSSTRADGLDHDCYTGSKSLARLRGPDLSLIHVNHLIHEEALPILFKGVGFVFDMHATAMLHFLKSIDPKHLQYITSITLCSEAMFNYRPECNYNAWMGYDGKDSMLYAGPPASCVPLVSFLAVAMPNLREVYINAMCANGYDYNIYAPSDLAPLLGHQSMEKLAVVYTDVDSAEDIVTGIDSDDCMDTLLSNLVPESCTNGFEKDRFEMEIARHQFELYFPDQRSYSGGKSTKAAKIYAKKRKQYIERHRPRLLLEWGNRNVDSGTDGPVHAVIEMRLAANGERTTFLDDSATDHS